MPQPSPETKWMLIGNYASLVAGLVIEALLLEIYLHGVSTLFDTPTIYWLLALLPLGIVAYTGYSKGTRHAKEYMQRVSPLALILAGIGAITAYQGLLGVREAGLFIVAAYFVELLVGQKLAKDLSELDELGSRLFLIGVTVFVLSLGLVLVDNGLALIPLIGNTVKITGFAKIVLRNTPL